MPIPDVGPVPKVEAVTPLGRGAPLGPVLPVGPPVVTKIVLLPRLSGQCVHRTEVGHRRVPGRVVRRLRPTVLRPISEVLTISDRVPFEFLHSVHVALPSSSVTSGR
jgi:hypothetical protein